MVLNILLFFSLFITFILNYEVHASQYLTVECNPTKSLLEKLNDTLKSKNYISNTLDVVIIKDCSISVSLLQIDKILKENNQTINELLFRNVSSLEKKHLTGIDNTGIDKIHFEDLHFQKILPDDVFSTIPNLKKLWIVVMNPENVPSLVGLQHLQFLNIEVALFGSESSYKNLLTNILKMKSNEMKHLHLSLAPNDKVFINLHKETFAGKFALENILLKSVGIEYIHEHTFSHMSNLTNLFLPYNNLKIFNPNFLPDSLIHLDLFQNELTSFNINQPLNKLTMLDLGHNQLRKFTLDLNHLPNLVNINLMETSMQQLKVIDSNVKTALKSIDLRANLFEDAYAWKWALDHLSQTWTNLNYTYPPCDCRVTDVINEVNKHKYEITHIVEDLVTYCRASLTTFVLLEMDKFSDSICNITELQHKCEEYEGSTDHIKHLMDGKVLDAFVVNCSNVANVVNIQAQINGKAGVSDGFWVPAQAGPLFLVFQNNKKLNALPSFSSVSLQYKDSYIFAENSKINSIQLENLPEKLVELRLANNYIQKIETKVLDRLSVIKTNMTLSGNPFICDCSHQDMYHAIISLSLFILDYKDMRCADGTRFDPDRVLCVSLSTILLYFFISISIVIAICLGFYLRNSLEVQVYVYSRGWFPAMFRPESDDKEYEYDVFLSFSDVDQEEVSHILQFLEEDQNPPYRVCYHHRDWVGGDRIDRQIINSVENSRKTIIFLSQNFLDSYWANMEFITAHYKMLQEKAPKLLVIVHGKVDINPELHPEIKTYIKTTTYLKSDDRWFHKKLLYALRRPNIYPNKKNDEMLMS